MPQPSGLTLACEMSINLNHPIGRIAWCANGQWLASADGDRVVRIWNTSNGQLCHELTPHGGEITAIAWSRLDHRLATAAVDERIRIWRIDDTGPQLERAWETDVAESLAWSPNASVLASGSASNLIRLWTFEGTGATALENLAGHEGNILAVDWNTANGLLASASEDGTVRVWQPLAPQHKQLIAAGNGHNAEVYSLCWPPDGTQLVSASQDRTIRVWAPDTGRTTNILHGHTDEVICVSFSNDGALVASKSLDHSVCLWRSKDWRLVHAEQEPCSGAWMASLAFSPRSNALATLGSGDTAIRLWTVDQPHMEPAETQSYRNAKVVLLGHTGVGKSGLARVLTGQPFAPTDSTHGREVHVLRSGPANTPKSADMAEIAIAPADILPMSANADGARDYGAWLTSVAGELSSSRFQQWCEAEQRATVLVITDIVSSPVLMAEPLEFDEHIIKERYLRRQRQQINEHDGLELSHLWNACIAAFHTAEQALAYAQALQRPYETGVVPVRSGIHITPLDRSSGLSRLAEDLRWTARLSGIGGAGIWLSKQAHAAIHQHQPAVPPHTFTAESCDGVEVWQANNSSVMPRHDSLLTHSQDAIGHKLQAGQYDVFLSYNTHDRLEVIRIAKQLTHHRIMPWLDVWELRPGRPWQQPIEHQIESIATAAVFIGAHGVGSSQSLEIQNFLTQSTKRCIPVIPVYLPSAPEEASCPPLLSVMQAVDFRQMLPDPMNQLVFGITQIKPQ